MVSLPSVTNSKVELVGDFYYDNWDELEEAVRMARSTREPAYIRGLNWKDFSIRFDTSRALSIIFDDCTFADGAFLDISGDATFKNCILNGVSITTRANGEDAPIITIEGGNINGITLDGPMTLRMDR